MFGSLKDVKSIKGNGYFNELKRYMKINNIPFEDFLLPLKHG